MSYRFGIAGAANTLLGFLIIAALDLAMGVEPRIANAIGYLVGLIASFVLNRGFVFESKARWPSTGPRFLVAAALSFALNQAVLSLAIGPLGHDGGPRMAAQLLGMAAYTAAMFTLLRLWVFRDALESRVSELGGIAQGPPPPGAR